jgi:hypothetical protein
MTDQPEAQQPEPSNSVPNVSGGVKVDAEQITVGGNLVGRDKNESAGGHIIHIAPGATVIFTDHPRNSSMPLPPLKPSFLFLERHKYNYPFVGRDEMIGQLHAALSQNMEIEARPVVVCGLGGAGKTRLAIEYAQRYRERYPGGVYGINAAADWDSQLRSIAVDLDLPSADRLGTELMLRKYLNDHPQSLLIIDDVDDPRSLWGEHTIGIDIADLKCRVLVTARSVVEGERFQTLKVNSLSTPEALRLLLTASKHHDLLHFVKNGDADKNPGVSAAQDICRLLGNLPLAITIAAAYLNAVAMISLGDYRDRLRKESGLKAVDAAAGQLTSLDFDYERTMSATLQLQWDALKDENARLLLKTMALLGKNEWRPCTQIALLAGLSNEAEPGYPTPLISALISLRRFALIEERAANRPSPDQPVLSDSPPTALPDYIRLHALVQDFARQQISANGGEEGLRRNLEVNLISALNDTVPFAERRQAALLLADLQWLGEAWISLFPDTLLKYMEVVARYISTDAERRYLEERLNLLLDASKLIKLTTGEQAQLLVQRAALRGPLGKPGLAADDYLTAEHLAGEEDAKLAARIKLGLANLVRREYQKKLAQSKEANVRQEAEAGLRVAVGLYLQADEFGLRYGQDPILRAHILQQLAYTYALLADWASADRSFRAAQDRVEQIEDATAHSIHLARVQETWSQVYFEQGKHLRIQNDPGALAAFGTAYDIVVDEIETLNKAKLENYEYVLAHYNAGEILLHESRCPDCQAPRLTQAHSYFEAVLEMARRLKFDDLVSDAEESRQEVQRQLSAK